MWVYAWVPLFSDCSKCWWVHHMLVAENPDVGLPGRQFRAKTQHVYDRERMVLGREHRAPLDRRGGAKLRPKNHPAHWYPAKITSGVGTNSIAISSFQTHTYSVYTIQTIVIRSDALSQASESALASWVVAETGCPPSGSTSNEKSSSLGPPSAPRPTGSPPGALWRKGGTRPGLRGPRSP